VPDYVLAFKRKEKRERILDKMALAGFLSALGGWATIMLGPPYYVIGWPLLSAGLGLGACSFALSNPGRDPVSIYREKYRDRIITAYQKE
jgi:hypothetical protein